MFCKHLGLLLPNLLNGQRSPEKQMEAILRKQKAINVCGHLEGFRLRSWLLGVSAWDAE